MSKCIYTQEQFDKMLEERNKLANENFKLKHQLAEWEKDSNATLNEYRAMKCENKQLQRQLKEKDKGFNWLHQKFAKYIESNKDKISFCIEQLEKVKNMLPEENIPIYPYEILHKLINQIEELKKEKN